MRTMETEYVVVGSGPGGATVARELARNGRRVVLVERGRDRQWAVGRLASIGAITHVIKSREGGIMARGVTTGGSTVVFNGNAYDPPVWMAQDYGIDLMPFAEEIKREIGIKPLEPEFYRNWKGTLRMVDSAGAMGVDLAPQKKYIDSAVCRNTCDDCMLGCRHDAKWTARRYIRDAVEAGAQLLTGAPVDAVTTSGGKATGVEARTRQGRIRINAGTVVLAAGGIGTPIILQQSGIQNAGDRFFIDPMNVCMGVSRDNVGTVNEMTFTFSSDQFVESEGFLVSNVGGRTVLAAQLSRKGLRYRSLLKLMNYKGFMGMFVKIGDTPGGSITADGKISKPYTAQDHERFRKGTDLCKNILIGAGCDPDSITVAEDIGGHPGGTAAIDRVVDRDLRTEIEGLYVCDASVFPESPGRPPSLTIIAMALWFSRKLIKNE